MGCRKQSCECSLMGFKEDVYHYDWSFEFGGACFDGDRRLIETFTAAKSLKNPGFW